MVEFALILPILLLVTLGVVDLARIFSSYIALTDGVREAALYAAEDIGHATKWCSGDANDIACPPGSNPLVNETHNDDNIAFWINTAGLDASRIHMRDPECRDAGSFATPCDSASTIRIAATYEMDILVPILGDLLGNSVKVQAHTTAQVLQ